MSEAIEQWLRGQQKIVEVSGRHAEAVKLYGPDDAIWGQWPIEVEDLPDQVESIIVQISEQLPRGNHKGSLVVYDSKGDQWSAFPIVFSGRSSQAATAAQETKTLQAASSIAISNLETVILTQRNEIERLAQSNDSHLEDIAKLVEIVMGFQTENAEVNIMMAEAERKQQRLDDLVNTAKPALAVLSQLVGQQVMQKAMAVQKKAADNGGQSTNGPSNDSSIQPTSAKAPSTGHDENVSAAIANGNGKRDRAGNVRARKSSKKEPKKDVKRPRGPLARNP